MSLKRPFVPKSDVKQRSTTTLKSRICYFEKWQIPPFNTKLIIYLKYASRVLHLKILDIEEATDM